jgi:UDP:flavonoid glycosyltransferase YjiC (YdhE family)
LRLLFASLPAVGHVAPLSALADALARRGHAIAWATAPSLGAHLLPARAALFPVDPPAGAPLRADDGPAALARRFFTDTLPRAAAAMAPGVRAAVDAFSPDLVITEPTALAGPIAAEGAGIPWVSVHLTPALLLRRFSALPGAEAWIQAQVDAITTAAGLPPRRWPPRGAASLVATSRAFLGDEAELDPADALVGALVPPVEPVDLGAWLGPRPRVLVALGTEAGRRGDALLAAAVEALPDGVSAVVASPRPLRARPGLRVAPWVPQRALIPHVDAILCHGGQGTVHEALLAGLPPVCAPLQHDQPAVAARLVALGAGLRVSPAADAPALRAALDRALSDPALAAAARALGATLGPGNERAADLVEAVA